MSKVHYLDQNKQSVKELTKAVDDASGDITCIGVVFLGEGSKIYFDHAGDEDLFALVGGLESLKSRIIRRIEEDYTEVCKHD